MPAPPPPDAPLPDSRSDRDDAPRAAAAGAPSAPAADETCESLTTAPTAVTDDDGRARGDRTPGGLAPGRRIGPWRVMGPLGAGGMGTVHRVERDDGAFRTQAALKVLNPWLLGGDFERRFARERQILADLRHPSIANLIDGGVTAEGVPYLVLEYVQGETITRHAARHRLGLRERLALFHRVCLAVQHAHQNLVVHRDLKPGNILVDESGQPKLLDFGIAKLVDVAPDREAETAAPGTLLLTPGYASPEQLRGETVTTASDVYALGVVLYELLVGDRPPAVDASTRNAPTLTRPSTAVQRTGGAPGAIASAGAGERGRWSRLLRGDLDTIVLKALAFEPERRYQSAQQLADDLQRYLDHQPVQARPDSFGYRLRKLAARHPVGVGLGLAAVALLLASAVGLAFLAAGLAAERDRAAAAQADAERAARTAERTVQFLASLFRNSDPRNRGGGLTARELLDAGSRRLEQELADEPETLAYLAFVIGGIERQLGLLESAERNLRRSVAIRRERFGPRSREVGESLSEHADVLRMLSRMDESETLQREALAIREALDPPDPVGVGQSLNNLALVIKEAGRFQEASPIYKRAMAVRLASLGPDHPLTLVTRINLGMLERDLGRFDAAEVHLREVLEKRLALFGEEHFSTANALTQLGRLEELQGRFVDAERWFRRALAAMRATAGEAHPNTASALADLGGALEGQGRLDEAERLYREALALQERSLPAAHPELASTRALVGRVLAARGHGDEGEAQLREALEMLLAGDAVRHPRVARVQADLAAVRLARGDAAAAIGLLESALAIRRAAHAPTHPAVADTLKALATAQEAAGHPAAAAANRREAAAAVASREPASAATRR